MGGVYHLLDGDLASNFISWQWNSGTSRNKIYFANQENINKYSRQKQSNTFLDKSYEELAKINTPEEFKKSVNLNLKTNLELFQDSKLIKQEKIESQNVVIFHPWMLDAQLDFSSSFLDADFDKVLLIEPSHFKRFPISDKRIEFILYHSLNIPKLKIFIGKVTEFKESFKYQKVISIFHPAIKNWQKDLLNLELKTPEYIFPEVTKFYPSFFGYWKACNKVLKRRIKGSKWH